LTVALRIAVRVVTLLADPVVTAGGGWAAATKTPSDPMPNPSGFTVTRRKW
jgi:hypothetical protein